MQHKPRGVVVRLGGSSLKVAPVLGHLQFCMPLHAAGIWGGGFGTAVARPRSIELKHPDIMQEMLYPPKLLMRGSIDRGVKIQTWPNRRTVKKA
jgi:hypothetical protein